MLQTAPVKMLSAYAGGMISAIAIAIAKTSTCNVLSTTTAL